MGRTAIVGTAMLGMVGLIDLADWTDIPLAMYLRW